MKTHLSSKEPGTLGLDVDMSDMGEVGEDQEERHDPAEGQQDSWRGSRVSGEQELAIPANSNAMMQCFKISLA